MNGSRADGRIDADARRPRRSVPDDPCSAIARRGNHVQNVVRNGGLGPGVLHARDPIGSPPLACHVARAVREDQMSKVGAPRHDPVPIGEVAAPRDLTEAQDRIQETNAPPRRLPSVDEVMRATAAAPEVADYGRAAVVDSVRAALGEARAVRRPATAEAVIVQAQRRLDALAQPNLKAVFNLTGTVLHTNLGRALIAEEAVEAAVAAMRNAVALEFDLATGKR